MAGDYNFDGIVGTADFAVWRAQFGQTSAIAIENHTASAITPDAPRRPARRLAFFDHRHAGATVTRGDRATDAIAAMQSKKGDASWQVRDGFLETVDEAFRLLGHDLFAAERENIKLPSVEAL